MAFHLKLLAKFSLNGNHLLNYSCYILEKFLGFEIPAIPLRLLSLTTTVSLDTFIRVFAIRYLASNNFPNPISNKLSFFQINRNSNPDFFPLYQLFIPRRDIQSNRYRTTRFSPLQIRKSRCFISVARSSARAVPIATRSRNRRAWTRDLRCEHDRKYRYGGQERGRRSSSSSSSSPPCESCRKTVSRVHAPPLSLCLVEDKS